MVLEKVRSFLRRRRRNVEQVEPTRPKPWKEVTEREEGIFRVRKEEGSDGKPCGYYNITNYVTEGTIKSITLEPLHFYGEGYDQCGKDSEGAHLEIICDEKTGRVDFPRKLSKIEQDALLGRRITYSLRRSEFDEGPLGALFGYDYTIKVLDGPHAGTELKEKVST